LRARAARNARSPSLASPSRHSSSSPVRRHSDSFRSSSSRQKRTYESASDDESESQSESENERKEKRHRSDRGHSEKGKDREKEKDRHKEKKRKRRDREEREERRSVLTGKKIRLKVHKDAADYERDKKRADLLEFLNSAY